MNAFICTFTLCALAQAGGQQPSYTDSTMHFSVKVPTGWVLLTDEQLAEIKRLEEKTFGERAAKYDARMRLVEQAPIMLPSISVLRWQRKPPTLPELRDDLAKLHENALNASAPVIDATRSMVAFSQDERTVEGVELTRNVAVSLGKLGGMSLVFLCPKTEVESYRNTWHALLDSAKFEEGFGYVESATAVTPARDPPIWWIIAGGFLVLMFMRWVRYQRTGR